MSSFTAQGSVLHSAAEWVARALPAKPPTPLLGGILVEFDDDGLTFTAYDFETAATVVVPCITRSPGRVLVSGRLFAVVAKAASKAVEVLVTCDDSVMTVVSGKSRWSMPLMSPLEYPAIPVDDFTMGEMDSDDLRRIVARVAPVVDKGGNIAVLGAVQVVQDGDALVFAATDSFRLGTGSIPWKPPADPVPPVLVPTALLEMAAKALHAGETIRFGAAGGAVSFASSTHTLTGRVMAGEFPRWQGLMPSGPAPSTATLRTADLVSATADALIMLDAEAPLRLDFGPDGVRVEAIGDSRSALVEMDLSAFEGEPISVAVKPGFIRDALTCVGSAEVELRFGVSGVKPVLVVPIGAGDDYRHLLMPIRLPK